MLRVKIQPWNAATESKVLKGEIGNDRWQAGVVPVELSTFLACYAALSSRFQSETRSSIVHGFLFDSAVTVSESKFASLGRARVTLTREADDRDRPQSDDPSQPECSGDGPAGHWKAGSVGEARP